MLLGETVLSVQFESDVWGFALFLLTTGDQNVFCKKNEHLEPVEYFVHY